MSQSQSVLINQYATSTSTYFIPITIVLYNVGVAGEGWKPWDYAAGGLMITEAGGVMTDLTGKPFHLYDKSMIASASNTLQLEAIRVIQDTISQTIV